MAENILRMLRPDKSYTELEAKVLDIALVLHMEHGGGNNSTFTTHVVTSSGSDTYSVVAAALSSLKGPKHGGANIKVVEMMQDLRKNVDDLSDEGQVEEYLRKLLHKEAFDKKGLIYGNGTCGLQHFRSTSPDLQSFCKEAGTCQGKRKRLLNSIL